MDLTDKDDNGYCFLKASECNVLISTNVNVHAVGGALGRLKVKLSVVQTMFVARSRTSRVGTMKRLKRGFKVPICSAPRMRTKVGGDCYVARGLSAYMRCLRGNRAVRLRSFTVATFRMPRSKASGMNCYVGVSNGVFSFLASLKRVAPATTRCVYGTGCLMLRTGCSRRVLGVKPCPRCLGRHVTKPGKRVDGHRATSFLTRGVGRDLGCV